MRKSWLSEPRAVLLYQGILIRERLGKGILVHNFFPLAYVTQCYVELPICILVPILVLVLPAASVLHVN